MCELYYRSVDINNIKRIKKLKSNNQPIGLSNVIKELSGCNKNCLSLFAKTDTGSDDDVLTSLIFAKDNVLNNHYIVLTSDELFGKGFMINSEPAKNLSYLPGRELHRNICELNIDHIPDLIDVFSNKNVLSIERDDAKKLVLLALKGSDHISNIDMMEIKEKFLLVQILLALREDTSVFSNSARLELIEKYTSIYNEALKSLHDEYFSNTFDLL